MRKFFFISLLLFFANVTHAQTPWYAFHCDETIYEIDDRYPDSCPGTTEEFIGMRYYFSYTAWTFFLEDIKNGNPIYSAVKNLMGDLSWLKQQSYSDKSFGLSFRFNRSSRRQDCSIVILEGNGVSAIKHREIPISSDCYRTMLRLSRRASEFFKLEPHVWNTQKEETKLAVAGGVLNLYSSRHYDTDERLYSEFTAATGIEINRIEGKADELIARMEAEGENSPVDVFLTVDTVRITRAKKLGLLQSIDSPVLEAKIPAYLQDVDNQWFAFSQRARILFYDKNDVANPPQTYQDLAKPEYKGRVCIRSSSNVYTQNITAALVAHLGADAIDEWAKGVVANFARDPQGGDTDQLRGIASGECDIAMSNTYYYARALRKGDKSMSAEDLANIGWVFPNQNSIGAHMNISGGGVARNAPNKKNAIKFLEYLASEQAQEYFSAGNDEYPAVPGIGITASVAQLGVFRPDTISLSDIAANIAAAQRVLNEAGWK